MQVSLATMLLSLAFLFGALLVPDVGERKLLDDCIGANDKTFCLYKTDVTPAEGDTLGSYTEADFTGYAAKTLTAGSWNAASTSTGTTSKTYAAQVFTSSGASQTIYGYFVKNGATLLWSEKFATARTLVSPDTLTITPAIQLD